MEGVQVIGSLIISGVAIVFLALVAIIPPLYNHKKAKQYNTMGRAVGAL